MRPKHIIITAATLLILTLILTLLINTPPPKNKPQLLETNAFEQLIQNPEVFLINTHTPYEGEIEGTDLILEDWQNIALHHDKLPQNKNTPLAVYCKSGRMSASAAQQLTTLGYKNVYDLKGGMNTWKQSGRTLLTTPPPQKAI